MPETSDMVTTVSVVVGRADPRTAAHALLRAEVAALLGGDGAVIGHACPRCGSGEHGRPYVVGSPALHVSLSRAGECCVVALTDAGPVGVDVEPATAAGFDGFDAVALHPHESAADDRARSRTWVRKESLLKATGRGLHLDPREVWLSPADRPPRLLGLPFELPATAWIYDLELPAGHVGAVTVLSEHRPALTQRAAAPAARSGPATR